MGSPTSGTPDKKQGQTQPQPQTQSGDNQVPAAPAIVQLPPQTMQKLEIATPAAQFIEQDVGAAIEAAVRGQGGTAPTCASLGQFVSTGRGGNDDNGRGRDQRRAYGSAKPTEYVGA